MNYSIHQIIRKVIDAAWRRRYLILIPIIIMPALGLIASLLMPKTYETRTTILVQEPSRMNPFLNEFSIATNIKERFASLDALLHSEHVIAKVLDDISDDEPELNPVLREQLIASLSSKLSMQLIGSELVEVKMRSTNPEGLKETLDAVSKRLIERIVSPERDAVVSSGAFLSTQMEEHRVELRRAEDMIAEFQTRNADNLPAMQSANITRLAGLQQKLEEKSIELASVETVFSTTVRRLSGTNPIVGGLEEKIVQLSGELATLRGRYANGHSLVQAVERNLSHLMEERKARLAEAPNNWGSDLDRLWNMAAGKTVEGEKNAPPLLLSQMQKMQELEARRASLAQEVDQIRQAISSTQSGIEKFGPIEQEQKRLERAVLSARDIYDTLERRSGMARVVEALGRFESPERIKVIDPPKAPTKPISPPPIVFLVISLVAGIALGIGLAIVTETLDPIMHDPFDIAAAAGVGLIAVVEDMDKLPIYHHRFLEVTHVPNET